MIQSDKFHVFFVVSFLAAFLFLIPTHARADDTQLIIDFADWLHSGGDDVSAEAEYLRYLFVTGTANPHAVSTLARIYRSRGDSEKLLSLSERYTPLIDDKSVAENLSFFHGYSLLKLQKWQSLDDLLKSNPNMGNDGDTGFALSLASDIYQGKLNEAKAVLRAHADISTGETDDLITSIKTELASYAPKKRAVAVGLSALIPGLGKAYARQYGDAFVSFAITSTLVALTSYTACSEGAASWKPWVYGVSAGAFYSANLYGSSEAAVRYNETHEKSLKSKVDEILAHYPH